MTVITEEIPHVPPADRVVVERFAPDFYRITIVYGFQDTPDIPAVLKGLLLDGKPFNLMDTTFFLGRETLIPSSRPGMALWREKLFAWMSRAEGRATTFFGIPPNRVVELGMQVEL
jgi:KUP system potassium uptake protein